MEEVLKFNISLRVMDMYRFLMKHAYRGISGAANIVISGGAFVLYLTGVGKGDDFARLMLLLIAALFTVINPVYLLYKAAKQVKLTPMFQKPLEYTIDSKGILVKQGEEELPMLWEEVRKVIETKKDIYIYLSLTRAYIFPKEFYKNDIDTFKELLTNHLNDKICKIKKK